MAIIKCKMCGGDLLLTEGATTAECEYCGSVQTVPTADNEKKLTLFARANRLRSACEFDKAAGIYESIVADFPEEAEAYWGLVLCKYGIEYVDDPGTGKKIPTCHRSSFDSVMQDSNFDMVMETADVVARRVYRDEAKQIEELRKGIIEVSSKEEPYEIFICYKETDDAGQRTLDSVIAQDVYDALTAKGYRTFFSRITLEDKLGTEYEPYIFAALNSAKIMLAFGTDYEYFNAVWVKNEWGRFLKLMAQDKSKHLIPCYKGIDAYDMPPEFAKLQAQDMGKVGAMQDLLRGIEKILPRHKNAQESIPAVNPYQQIIMGDSGRVDALLKRGRLALEDGEWENADRFFEEALNLNAECAQAYLGKAMVQEKCIWLDGYVKKRLEHTAGAVFETLYIPENDLHIAETIKKYELSKHISAQTIRNMYRCDRAYSSRVGVRKAQFEEEKKLWDNHKLIGRAIRFSDAATKAEIDAAKDSLLRAMTKRIMDAEEESAASKADVQQRYAAHFAAADAELRQLYDEAQQKMETVYQSYADACEKYSTRKELFTAVAALEALGGYKDSAAIALSCREKAAQIKAANKRAASARREDAKRGIKIALAVFAVVAVIGAVVAMALSRADNPDAPIEAAIQHPDVVQPTPVLDPLEQQYIDAEALAASGEKAQAAIAFGKLGDYKDARERSMKLRNEITVLETISAGGEHTVAVKENGTVIATGSNHKGQCNVSDWTDIVAISAGYYHTIGLKSDGTVVAVGENVDGQCNVEDWTDIVAVDTGSMHTIGLKSNGTVVAVGAKDYDQCNVEDWTDIVAISAGGVTTFGLKSDGTVLATEAYDYLEEVNTWTDIVAISAGYDHTIGLKSDGTVVAAGKKPDGNEYGQCDVANWTDIVAINAGSSQSHGLKADGTIVSAGDNSTGECETDDWTDIVAISGGGNHTVGLKADGTVVSTGYYKNGQCNVDDWTDIMLPEASFGKLGDYQDARERSMKLRNEITVLETISAGIWHTVAVKENGTVIATGRNRKGECNVSDWTDIVAVSAGLQSTVGLKSDGTVVVVGKNEYGECNVEDWTDIVAVDTGSRHTIGLKSNGTVVAVGDKDYDACNVEDWTDIVAISAGKDTTIGLKSDGTVLATGAYDYLEEVNTWTDIVAISAGYFHTIGLKSDGTVVAAGEKYDGNKWGQCDVANWTDIVAINAGGCHSLGLKADGTIVAAGYNYHGECETDDWTDIVAISGGGNHTVGLKADGTVVSTGYNKHGQCNVDDWTDIMLPEASFGKLGDYKDARERSMKLRNEITVLETISAAGVHTVAVKENGTVIATGRNSEGQCNVSDWTDIVAVSACGGRTVGLKSDGTVVAVGENEYGECNVEDWTDIVAVDTVPTHTIGLKSNGTVVAVGDKDYDACNVEDWTDIVAISAGLDTTIGLKSDGTVLATGAYDYLEEVNTWTDIVAISAGFFHTIGLKSDGTVVAAGKKPDGKEWGQCDVANWTDIVAINAGDCHSHGLKADGTVVSAGYNYHGECETDDWTDIVAISGGYYYTVGLKADGTVVSTGYNKYGQCNVDDWTDIKMPK